jgi:voltage-gated potassium channel
VRLRGRRAHLRTVLALLACMIGYYAVPYGARGWNVHGYTGLLLFAAAAALLGAVIIRQISERLLSGGGGTHPLHDLVIALFLLVIAFSLVYLRIADQFDDLNTKTDALYFTMTTLSTVGFGDIHAVGQTARALVTVQMALDLVYVATVAAVVAGIIGDRARARRNGHAP